MRKAVAIVAVLLALASAAQAQDVVSLSRADWRHGEGPVFMTALLSGWGEVYVFGIPHSPDVEVGRLWPLATGAHQVLAGGYLTWQPKLGDRIGIQPWVQLGGPALGGRYSASLAGRLPLDGSPAFFFSDEASQTWGLAPWLRVGVAGTAWVPEGGSGTWGVGPSVGVSVGRVTVTSRFTFGQGGAPDAFRVKLRIVL